MKALDPKIPNENKYAKNAWVNKSFTYAGIKHPTYYCYDDIANQKAIKNGGSTYAIVIDLDVANLHIYRKESGKWVPDRTYNAGVGSRSLSSSEFKNKKQYAKGNTPMGLHYINGNRQPVANSTDYCHYWVAFGAEGHNYNNEDYIHYSPAAPKGSADGLSGNVKGSIYSPGCVTLSWERSEWIYCHCGRGTPVLIW